MWRIRVKCDRIIDGLKDDEASSPSWNTMVTMSFPMCLFLSTCQRGETKLTYDEGKKTMATSVHVPFGQNEKDFLLALPPGWSFVAPLWAINAATGSLILHLFKLHWLEIAEWLWNEVQAHNVHFNWPPKCLFFLIFRKNPCVNQLKSHWHTERRPTVKQSCRLFSFSSSKWEHFAKLPAVVFTSYQCTVFSLQPARSEWRWVTDVQLNFPQIL